MERSSPSFRPDLSPIIPKIILPRGLMINPTAKTMRVLKSAEFPSEDGKKIRAKIEVRYP
jgi:hypothetical protein